MAGEEVTKKPYFRTLPLCSLCVLRVTLACLLASDFLSCFSLPLATGEGVGVYPWSHINHRIANSMPIIESLLLVRSQKKNRLTLRSQLALTALAPRRRRYSQLNRPDLEVSGAMASVE